MSFFFFRLVTSSLTLNAHPPHVTVTNGREFVWGLRVQRSGQSVFS